MHITNLSIRVILLRHNGTVVILYFNGWEDQDTFVCFIHVRAGY